MRPSLQVQDRGIDSWEEFQSEAERLRELHWIYRGLPNRERAQLKPSLERCKETYNIPSKAMLYVEGGLIRRFKRTYHHYSADAPSEFDYTEWLALMRHHGAPTRLLDWTHSIYIALFFALERSETPAVIWALNVGYLDKQISLRFPSLYKRLEASRNVRKLREFKSTFGRENPPLTFVSALNPYRLNQRLTVQQGTFLAQGNLQLTFEQNLAATIGEKPSEGAMRMFTIARDPDLRREMLRRLHRMGINRASLFPGLDGFAHSLEQLLNFQPAMNPPDRGYCSKYKATPLPN
jgi:hypothetical protein